MQVPKLANQDITFSGILSRAKGRGSSILRVLTANPKIAVGAGIIAFFVLIALAAPLLTPYGPVARIVRGAQPPSPAHILGTTGLGQDMFAQIVYGARVSILVGFFASVGSTLLQVSFGLTAAYFGGVIDDVLSLITNVFLILPGLPLAIVLASLASASGANKNEVMLALVLLVTSWSYGARVLRAQTLSLKEREFVTAARASGETTLRIIFAEVLPNELALVATNFLGTFVYTLGAEVGLEFLGLGNTSQATWGVILYWANANGALLDGQWWMFVPAGLCVALLCAGIAFMNFGIDEVADPRLRVERPPRKPRKQMMSKGMKEGTNLTRG